MRYAKAGDQLACANRLIDVRQFKFRPAPEFGAWRDEQIIPRYNAQGVKKFAFLLGEQVDPVPDQAVEGPANFVTGYFTLMGQIETWYAAD